MGVSFMVRCSTEAECQREVDWLQQARGAVPTMLPTNRLGDGWVARVVMPKAPAGGEGLDGR
ncbi:hypothetical protein ACLF6K_37415 [Streptomyces xanthophaeus]|uniref:hypothetical protein n=1 Tax=Streptomyces xanthophaeus TaxID=67385 RepID=UPI0039902C9B